MVINPESKEPKTNDQKFIETGLAQRLLDHMRKEAETHINKQYEDLTFGVEECDFNITKDKDPETERITYGIAVEMPNPNTLNRGKTPRVSVVWDFDTDRGTLSHEKELLTDEQKQLLEELKAEAKLPEEEAKK